MVVYRAPAASYQ